MDLKPLMYKEFKHIGNKNYSIEEAEFINEIVKVLTEKERTIQSTITKRKS
jgi:hypothetical protein